MVYNLYNGYDSILKSDAFELYVFPGNGFDSIIGIANDTLYFKIKQVFDSAGIYRYCQNIKIKTHSFKDSTKTVFCKNYPPFINKIVSFRGQKTYQINNKEYTVYHFIESFSNHTTYDSYFVNEIIPICYYSFDRDNYIYCDSIQGYEINTNELQQLKTKLLSDSTFFARYLLKKYYPIYHRPKS